MARPEKFKDEYIALAKKACKLGATDLDLAEMMDVSLRTIRYWRASKPEFAEALVAGKKEADDRVESSLYHRAMGYSHEETDIRVVDGAIVMTPVIKHYPPDTTAAIFWLKNRRSADWRDKRETEVSGTLNLNDLTDEELERRLAALETAKD